jgi:hypothetical protein
MALAKATGGMQPMTWERKKCLADQTHRDYEEMFGVPWKEKTPVTSQPYVETRPTWKQISSAFIMILSTPLGSAVAAIERVWANLCNHTAKQIAGPEPIAPINMRSDRILNWWTLPVDQLLQGTILGVNGPRKESINLHTQ